MFSHTVLHGLAALALIASLSSAAPLQQLQKADDAVSSAASTRTSSLQLSSVKRTARSTVTDTQLDQCLASCSGTYNHGKSYSCNQQLSCDMACRMRFEQGRSEPQCTSACDRTGSSGCSLKVGAATFTMCQRCHKGTTAGSIPQQCKQGCGFAPVPTGEALVKGKRVQTGINVPVDYTLEFELYPTGTVSEWSSVLHYTTNSDSVRLPAIFFFARTTRLHIVVGPNNHNFNPEYNLPLNVRTTVSLRVEGSTAQVVFKDAGGKVVASYKYSNLPARKAQAGINLYLGNPWYPAAKASMNRINIAPINAKPTTSVHPATGRSGSSAKHSKGVFYMTGPGKWVEAGLDGKVGFHFTETHRDGMSVYMRDASRAVRIQVDYWRMKIVYSEDKTGRTFDLFTITGATVNWQHSGLMRDVENQGSCGSCWAFASVHATQDRLSAAASIKTTSLSIQQVVDCTYPESRNACKGGGTTQAFNYMIESGLATSSSYPYSSTKQSGSGTCSSASKTKVGLPALSGGVVSSWTHKQTAGVAAMEKALEQGPITVAFQVYPAFFSFKHGVGKVYNCDDFFSHSGQYSGHAVEVVGFTSDYWIIKNSWGTSWGHNGYFYMKKGVNSCDIESWQVAYPKPVAYSSATAGTQRTVSKEALAVAEKMAATHIAASGCPMKLEKVLTYENTLVAGQRLDMKIEIKDSCARTLKLWGRVWKFGDHTAHTRVIDVVLPPTLMSTIYGGSGRVRKGDAWDEMVVITDVETN